MLLIYAFAGFRILIMNYVFQSICTCILLLKLTKTICKVMAASVMEGTQGQSCQSRPTNGLIQSLPGTSLSSKKVSKAVSDLTSARIPCCYKNFSKIPLPNKENEAVRDSGLNLNLNFCDCDILQEHNPSPAMCSVANQLHSSSKPHGTLRPWPCWLSSREVKSWRINLRPCHFIHSLFQKTFVL